LKKKIGTNVNTVAFFNILGPVLLNGINFFTISIFTRLLGTDNYGLYTIYYTWVNTFTIIISLQVIGTIGVANVKLPEEKREQYYSSILSIVLIMFCIVSALCLAAMPLLVKYMGISRPMIILMLFHALGMALVNFAMMRYTYEKKAHLTFSISMIVALSGIALSLILLKSGMFTKHMYYGRSYGAALPYIVLGVVILVVFMGKGRTFYAKEYWKFCLPLCLPMVFHGLSQLALAQADKVMLKNMMNDSVTGIYSFTYTFANVTNIIYNAFNNTWVPFYYEDVKAGNIESIHKRSKNYVFLFTALSIGFVLLAPDVVKIFAGRDFWSGISMIPVFVVANYMIFLYSFPVNYEFYHQKSIHIAIGTTGAAVVNCILNFLLIPKMGMSGAAYATALSYLALWIFHHLVSKYIIKEKYHYTLKTFLPGLAILILVSILVERMQNMILIRWIMAVIVGVIMLRHLWKTKSIF
jgi:O-antigen/teichoic acid export membrane protein